MTRRKVCVLRYLALVVGCMSKFTNGAVFVFNVYINAMKAIFNYSQTEVETVVSVMSIGLSLGIVAGAFCDRFGPMWTSVIGMFVTSGGYLLIYSAYFSVQFYSSNSGLLAFYYFIAGIGSTFTYMAAILTNVRNFLPKHRAKVVGLLDTMFGVSPALFALIYSYAFSRGQFEHPENQDVAGFMLMFAIAYAISNFLCVILLRYYPPDIADQIEMEVSREENSQSQSSVKGNSIPTISESSLSSTESTNEATREARPLIGSYHNQAKNSKGGVDRQEIIHTVWTKNTLLNKFLVFLKLLINPDFQLLFWTFSIGVSIAGMVFNNIAVVLKSAGLIKHQTVFTVLISAVGLPARLLIAPLSDFLAPKYPRSIFLIMASVLNILCHSLSIFYADTFPVLLTVTIITGVVLAVLWTLGPTIVSEVFALDDFGRNWGVFLFGQAMLLLFLQWVFGAVYDAHSKPGTRDCTGSVCSGTSFIVSTCLGVLSLLTSIGFFLRTRST